MKNGGEVVAIGPETDLSDKVEWWGDDLALLGKLPKAVKDAFKDAARPMVIVGGAALKGGHGAALKLAKTLKLVRALEDGRVWNGFNVVHMGAARMGGLMLGYAQTGGIADVIAAGPTLVFFLGAVEAAFLKFDNSFKVFLGHTVDLVALPAAVVLPY